MWPRHSPWFHADLCTAGPSSLQLNAKKITARNKGRENNILQFGKMIFFQAQVGAAPKWWLESSFDYPRAFSYHIFTYGKMGKQDHSQSNWWEYLWKKTKKIPRVWLHFNTKHIQFIKILFCNFGNKEHFTTAMFQIQILQNFLCISPEVPVWGQYWLCEFAQMLWLIYTITVGGTFL